MNNIKKYNESKRTWDIVASNDAKGIGTTNPKFLKDGENIISVDTAMERLKDDLTVAQGNISWLALHGGGGSGSGGGGTTPGDTEVNTTITVNDKSTGSQIIMDQGGLQIKLSDLSVKYNKGWNVIARIGSTQIYSSVANASNPILFVPYDTVVSQLQNHTGKLNISASYEDDEKGIYGSAQWSGVIIDNNIEMSCEDIQSTLTSLNTSFLKLYYSVGVVGNYKLTIKLIGRLHTITKEYDLVIATTDQFLKSIVLSDLIGQTEDYIDSYVVECTLQNKTTQSVKKTIKSTMTVVSSEILISSAVMSKIQGQPTEVSMDGSVNVVFTAYVSQYTSYKYNIEIDGNLVRQDADGVFGRQVSDYISVNNKPWTVANKTVPLKVTVTSGQKTATTTYYIKFIKSSVTYLSDTSNITNNRIFSLHARSQNVGDDMFEFTNTNYKSQFQIGSVLRTMESNIRSRVSILDSAVQYYRISNGAYAKFDDISLESRKYKFNDIISSSGDEFTIHIHYKADYHPDDERTILFSGNTSVADQNLGAMINGISIDVHNIYINNENVIQLEDNTENDITITCKKQTTRTQIATGYVDSVSYVVKVYLDGVLSAIRNLTTPIVFGDTIYLGARQYIKNGKSVIYNKCDVNIYNMNIYTYALNEFDIMVDSINNIVSTDYVNGTPNYARIQVELKKNFCERKSDGSIKSYLYNEHTGYNVDFLLDSNGRLNSKSIQEQAAFIGIPIVLIDVSNDSSWTFDQFVKQQSASSTTLTATTNKVIQYWDPVGINKQDKTGIDTSIKTINGVTIELQGTSTLADAVKNVNITVPDTTTFVPKSTWFPEQTYTLKADVVDSSHASNASIGSFINSALGRIGTSEYFPFDKKAVDNVYESDYVKKQQKTATLKHTVEGFPVFLIMKFYTDAQNKVSTTPLGIYSFNLGRNAYRNLGFKKVNKIVDEGNNVFEVTTFPFYKDKVKYVEEDTPNANWIEIKDTVSLSDFANVKDTLPEGINTSNGDFWQSDREILNRRFDVRYPSNKQVSDYPGFVQFVKNIMRFPIERCYSSDSIGTISKNYIAGSYDLYSVDNFNNYYKTGQRQDIEIDSNAVSAENLGFNVESAMKYFIIANFFGLVDNFGKNSTYRSWDGNKYLTDFYDLDCSMSGDNQGQLSITPDVWIKYLTNNGTVANAQNGLQYVAETFNFDEAISRKTVSANTNKLWLSLDTSFSRAVFGEDVNSLYTKYWYDFRKFTEDLAKSKGYDTFTNYFIDEYFDKQTSDCGSLIFNYDYKLKYLLQFTNDQISNTKDMTKLHGRKIAHSRNWLKKHTIFLDSLFKWRDTAKQQQSITFKSNADVSTGNSIMGTNQQVFPVTTNCPIISKISIGDTVTAFYFLQDNKETFVNVGNIKYGGPYNWNITNSNNFIKLGNANNKLSSMQVSILAATEAQNTIDALGFPALHEIDLSGNKHFSPDFKLDVFRKDIQSQIRTMDFSNTQCLDPTKTFVLDIEQNSKTPHAFTKFTKLTDINISGSKCITNIYIPTNVPLKTLQIQRSNINELDLRHQPYLKQIDLTGCNNLQTVYIEDCDGYTSLDLSGYNNLQKVQIINCKNLTNLTIANNVNLTQIAIENCPRLDSVRIINNQALIGDSNTNYVTLSDLRALTSIDLSSNSKLKYVTIDNCNEANIANLYLNGSAIKGSPSSKDILNLSKFTGLQTFNISQNSTVEYIQFANDKDKPITLTQQFQGCANLKRLYGNIVISSLRTFYLLNKFSLHGSDLSTVKFMNKSVVDTDGRVLMPYEITNQDSKSKQPPLNWKMPWQSGDGVTNITFGTQSCDYMFRETACTIFDVYYALSNLGQMKSLRGMFFQSKVNFERTATVDNSPNRYMYHFATGVWDIRDILWGCYKNIRIFSPEHDENNVTKDNGLFSPLIDSLTHIDCWANGFHGMFDRFMFRHSSKNYKINSFTGFFNHKNSIIVEDVNNAGFVDFDNKDNNEDLELSKTGGANRGNLTMFTKNLLTKNYTSCFNACFIDYDTITFENPVNSVSDAFISSYGKGTISFKNMFKHPQHVSVISAFACLGKGTTSVDFTITNQLFEGFTNLTHFNNRSTVNNITMFGDGYKKRIVGGFPENIFKDCKKLNVVRYLFSNSTAENLISIPELPGNLFINNPQLTDVYGLFSDLKFDYKLTGNSFANCTLLNQVSYLFANSSYQERIKSHIPYKLLYHGETDVTQTYYGIVDGKIESETSTSNGVSTTTVTITHKNGDIFKYKQTGETIEWSKDGTVIQNPEGVVYFKTTITTKKPNSKINFANNLFQYNYIQPYVNNSPEEIQNHTYQPYNILFINGKFQKAQPDTVNNTIMWSYDGVHKKTGVHDGDDEHDENLVSSVITRDNTILSGTLNYCCAPDLFRYCNGDAEIQNIFYGCGYGYNVQDRGGLFGRIPPILLLPFNGYTKNITGMFYNCTYLSTYTLSDGTTNYTIPKSLFKYCPNITTLRNTFNGITLYLGTNLSAIQDINKSILGDIGFAFAYCHYVTSNSSQPVQISGVFYGFNQLSYIRGAFCGSTLFVSPGKVKFAQVFTPNRYVSAGHNKLEYGEVFMNYGANAIHENPKTLLDNNTTKNYYN